jgi:hypothetical protein
MKCQKVRNMFSGYLEKTLPSVARASVEQHFAECGECKKLYSTLNSAVAMMERTPEVDPPAGLRSAVMARIDGIRQAKPRRVKWWQIDWERVFTVRVSAKAAAIGLGAVLAVGIAVQLSPYNSVTAGFFPRPKTTEITWGGDTGGVKVSGPWKPAISGAVPSNNGLKVSIVPDSSRTVSAYSVVLNTSGKQFTDCSVYVMGSEGSDPTLVSTFSGEGQKSVVRIEANRGDAPTLAEVRWGSGGDNHVETLVLPSRFDQPKPMGDSAWKGKMTIGQVLQLVSERFGVAFQASGDLNKTVALSMIEPTNVNEALYNSLLRVGFKYHNSGSRVYRVGPRD